MDRLAFYIRTEASNRAGLGHLFRMLAVSDRIYRVSGIKPLFLLTGERSALEIIKKRGFKLRFLDRYIKSEKDILFSILRENFLSVFIVDLPDLEGYRGLREGNKYIFVTLANKKTESVCGDIVIDVERQLKLKKRPGQILLPGHLYQILREEILAYRKRYMPRKKLKDVLVTFGGSDPYGVTLEILDMIPRISKEILFTVLLGPAFRHSRLYLKKYLNAPNIKLVSSPTDVLELMAGFDMAICGYGITSYELACLGVPSLIVGQVERQRNIIRRFSHLTGSIDLGMHTRLRWQRLKREIERLEEFSIRSQMWRKSRLAIDGLGARRVADNIFSEIEKKK